MRIINIMFARGSGGIEQAFVDYCEGLSARGHEVIAVIYPGAAVHQQLLKLSIPVIAIRNFSEWDFFASHALRKKFREIKPDAIIAHANRAYVLATRANKDEFPLVGVAHNYSTKRFRHARAVIAITRDLINHMVVQGVPENHLFHIPNMVKCHELPRRDNRNQPPVIGAMGRLVVKKGFDIYIDALKILKDRGCKFRAVLGGTGEEEAHLKKRAKEAGLEDTLNFTGWVHEKKFFYSHIDIFCLPSLHEPFGIVLLEAFAYGAPVVATDSEGPRDIITPNYDALIVKKGDAGALAEALAKLLDDERFANDMATNAFVKVKMRYSMEAVSQRIEEALEQIIGNWNK